MKVFEIIPINTDKLEWRGSAYQNRVVVRAENKASARIQAMMAFSICGRKHISGDAAFIPWANPKRSVCRDITGKASWPAEGPQGILEPRIS